MRKLLSMALALVMVCSMSVTAFAAGDPVAPDYSTTVTYVGQATEEYTVTVPATLAPGGSGEVKATGTWPSDKHLDIYTPKSVALKNGSASKTLDVTFSSISQYGSDTESINITKTISVDNFADGEAPLFGTWTGTITYNVYLLNRGVY